MKIITTQSELDAFCERAKAHDFLCVDTEFMRESTFYAILCLIQAATPDEAVIIDPLADMDLGPFMALLQDQSIIKVMHAARQDVEIFHNMSGKVPTPLFDSQVAAMALGYGDAVGYMALVKGRLDRRLDKGARFTDWSRRPLSDKQLSYAIGDVTHLCDMYPGLVSDLAEKGRTAWVEEETAKLLDENLYSNDPERAWERLKIRNPKRAYLGVLKAAASWREQVAIEKNQPRRRILKDDAMYDIAQQKPKTLADLSRLRSIPRGFEKSRYAQGLIKGINYALDNLEDYAPPVPKTQHMPPNLGPSVEMLKTLLRIRSDYDGIAPKLIASMKDVEKIAAFGEKADVPALSGWRREVFGEDALKMLRGEIALRLEGKEVVAKVIG